MSSFPTPKRDDSNDGLFAMFALMALALGVSMLVGGDYVRHIGTWLTVFFGAFVYVAYRRS